MADPDVTLTRAQYESLLLAALGEDTNIDVELLKTSIDAANSITRHLLQIRWYEQGGVTPTRIEIGNGVDWPPQLSFRLILDGPIDRIDVDNVLITQATNPIDPMVSSDPAGIAGWTLLSDWNWNLNAT